MGRKSVRVVTKPDVHHKVIPLANVLKNKLMWERAEAAITREDTSIIWRGCNADLEGM